MAKKILLKAFCVFVKQEKKPTQKNENTSNYTTQ